MLERALAKGDPVAGDCTVVETLDETETGIRYLAERHGHEVEVIEFFPVYATREGGTIRVAGAAAGLFRDGLAAFRKLGEFLRDSRHDSLGAVHDVKEADGTCCFIAERVEGADFGTALEMKLFVRPERLGRPDSRGRWDLEALLPRLLAGLAEVHRNGLMHGNINAANVVLRPDSTTPVLVGFGLGPLAYGGDEAVGPWTDVRALGELAHAALGGGRSDAGLTVREPGARTGTADRRLEEAVAAALNSDRGRGPRDAAALLDLLRGCRRRFLVPAAAACGGLVAVGALAWFLLGQGAPSGDGVFRDCAECPEMVVVPAGRLRMGCVSGIDCEGNESPVHEVEVGSFALGVYEVMFEEYDRFVQDTGYREPGDSDWGRGGRPVIYVSWEDAREYVAWLSRKTGESYRLPSESEWEYAARAGTTTRYSWGQDIRRNRANCVGCGSQWDNLRTAPAGSFEPNGWGLHDMHGNVWEWVEDCWHENYARAPRDGSAWTSGGDCSRRVLRGGSWASRFAQLSSANRYQGAAGDRFGAGFRVARTLD